MTNNILSKLELQFRALKQLVPYKSGLRKNAGAVQRMVESIQAYGFKIPLLIAEDGTLIDGELRLKAARKLGYTELPVIVCRDWSEERSEFGCSGGLSWLAP